LEKSIYFHLHFSNFKISRTAHVRQASGGKTFLVRQHLSDHLVFDNSCTPSTCRKYYLEEIDSEITMDKLFER